MTVQNPPIFVQEGSHPAEDTRRALEALAAGTSGYSSATALAVTERASLTNMSVDVAGGGVWVPGTEGTFQGSYFCDNRGTTNLAIAAADPTNPRIDLVVAQVEDSEYSGSVDQWSLTVITGTPALSPTIPSAPANSVALATVAVAGLATTITNADINDQRDLSQTTHGNVSIPGDLVVNGDVTATSDVSVIGNTSVGGDLTVTGNITGKIQTKVTILRDSFVIPSNSNTTLAFGTGTTVIDTDNFHSETTNNTRITVDEDGVYLINVSVYDLLSSDRALLNLYKGASIIGSFDSGVGYPHNDFTFSMVHKADATDYFTCVLYQNSGVSKTTDVDFSITLLHSI